MKKAAIKRKKLIAGIVAGKTQKQAAIDAGYSKKTAETQASQILKEPQVKSNLEKALDKAGLTDKRLADKHIELLDAQKTVSAVSGKDAGAGTVDFVDVPDYQTQARALDMAYKLKGGYVEKHEMTHKGKIRLITNVRND